jgi:single-strand DNA-binding protein
MYEARMTLTGNLGSDPEIRFLDSGRAVTSFSVCNTPRIKKNDEWQDGEPMWVRVTAWGKVAEDVVENLKKGMRVHVDGPLSQRSYETKEGEKRTSLELTADEVHVAMPRSANPKKSEPAPF